MKTNNQSSMNKNDKFVILLLLIYYLTGHSNPFIIILTIAFVIKLIVNWCRYWLSPCDAAEQLSSQEKKSDE